MNQLPLQANTLTVATAVFGAPILLAFVIGSLPVLIPVALFHWVARTLKPAPVGIVPAIIPQAA